MLDPPGRKNMIGSHLFIMFRNGQITAHMRTPSRFLLGVLCIGLVSLGGTISATHIQLQYRKWNPYRVPPGHSFHGFVLLPRRWVVERSFAWVTRFRAAPEATNGSTPPSNQSTYCFQLDA